MLYLAICFKRYLSALMRWEREWRRSIADVENLVFPWHRHTVSEIAVHVKVLVDGGQRSGVNCQNQDSQDSRIFRIVVFLLML
ncbi:hypothetical protein C6500_21015 [Candidatus Poribacteria bacterium]|nr:MAG: hypothetical protein C6500_21015 [Candidatus Poribacteria bacterium]